MIDTHAHLDGTEFADDINDVIARAKAAGIERIFIPSICMKELPRLTELCRQHPGYLHPMIGLHPENIPDEDFRAVLDTMEAMLDADTSAPEGSKPYGFIAVGEVGIDLYWDKSYTEQQIEAFERQIGWAKRYGLPLMIHSRAAHAELMDVMERHRGDSLRGVFHCFTGTEQEVRDLLSFPGFMLGIGGVSTFKKSTLPEVLKNAVPLSRIVLETDAPYMTPVPHRGKRNESSFVPHIAERLAAVYDTSVEAIDTATTANSLSVFKLAQTDNS